MKNLLVEIDVRDPRSGDLLTLRMSRKGAPSSATVHGDHVYLPVITDWGDRSVTVMENGEVVAPSVSHGDLSFLTLPQHGNADWTNFSYDGRPCRIWFGDAADPFSAYRQVFRGSCGAIGRDGAVSTLSLAGPEAAIAKDLLSKTYAGTGGTEGPADLTGVEKPWCSGNARNISGVLIDPIFMVYQFHGHGPTGGVSAVYENAYPIADSPTATVSSYQELIALPLIPGQWAHCPLEGLYRLGGAASGLVTADVIGATVDGSPALTVAQIVRHMLLERVTVDDIDVESLAQFTATWSFYSDSQVQLGDVVREALRQCSGYLLPDASGRWMAGDFFGAGPIGRLDGDRSSRPLVEGIKQIASTGPVYRVKVGHTRSWTVHSDDQISPALKGDAQEAIEIANAAYQASQQTSDKVDDALINGVTASKLAPMLQQRIDDWHALAVAGRSTGDKFTRNVLDLHLEFADLANLRFDVEKEERQALEVVVNDPETGLKKAHSIIADEQATRASQTASLASRALTLETTVNDPNTGLPAAHSAIKAEESARVAGQNAQADRATALEVTVNHPTTGVAATNGRIATEEKARADGDKVQADRTTSLEGTINNPSTGLAAAHAAVKTEESARVTAVQAQADRISTISSQVNHPSTGLPAAHSAISSEANTRASQDGALGQRIDSVVVRYDNFNNTGKTIEATVADVRQSIANEQGARATAISQATAEWNGNLSGVQQTLNTTVNRLGNVETSWSIRADANGNVAGVGLINGTNIKSEFGVAANIFSFTDPSIVGGIKPFYISGGVVRMQNVQIVNANLENASVSTLKILGNSIGVPFLQTFSSIQVGQGGAVVAETGWVSTGDASGGSGQVTFNAHQDGASAIDARCIYNLYLDTGGGYYLAWSGDQGARGTGGDVEFRGTVSMTASYSGASVRVRVTAQSGMIGNEGSNRIWQINSPSISIYGTKR